MNHASDLFHVGFRKYDGNSPSLENIKFQGEGERACLVLCSPLPPANHSLHQTQGNQKVRVKSVTAVSKTEMKANRIFSFIPRVASSLTMTQAGCSRCFTASSRVGHGGKIQSHQPVHVYLMSQKGSLRRIMISTTFLPNITYPLGQDTVQHSLLLSNSLHKITSDRRAGRQAGRGGVV